MKISIIISIISIFLSACDKKTSIKEYAIKESDRLEIIELNGLSIDEPVDILPLIDTIRYIKLELTEESIIGYIQKITVYENRIYILDTQTSSLFIFDMDGNYIFKIANTGQAPKEYWQLDFFDIDSENNQIVLTDLMKYRIMRYDLNGKFIYSTKIPFWVEGVAPNPNKSFVVYSNFRDNSAKLKQEYNLMYLDSSMNVRKAYFPYNSSTIKDIGFKFLTPQASVFYPYKEKFCFFSPYQNSIYELIDNDLVLKYSVDFGNESLDMETLMYMPDKAEARLKRDDFYSINRVQETDKLLSFSFTAPHSPLLYQAYYSKESKKIMCSAIYNIGKEGQFEIPPIAGYDSWLITELSIDYLLSWKKDAENTSIKNRFLIEKKNLTNSLSIDDNPVLIFYKLKIF